MFVATAEQIGGLVRGRRPLLPLLRRGKLGKLRRPMTQPHVHSSDDLAERKRIVVSGRGILVDD